VRVGCTGTVSKDSDRTWALEGQMMRRRRGRRRRSRSRRRSRRGSVEITGMYRLPQVAILGSEFTSQSQLQGVGALAVRRRTLASVANSS